jgi:hypothetical protein
MQERMQFSLYLFLWKIALNYFTNITPTAQKSRVPFEEDDGVVDHVNVVRLSL